MVFGATDALSEGDEYGGMPTIAAAAGGSVALLVVIVAIIHRKRNNARQGGLRSAARKGSLRLDSEKGSHEKPSLAVMKTNYHSGVWNKQKHEFLPSKFVLPKQISYSGQI